jgi:hypothetical protein
MKKIVKMDGHDEDKTELIKLEFFMDSKNQIQVPSTTKTYLSSRIDAQRIGSSD